MSDAVATTPSPVKLSWFAGILGAFLIFALIAAYSSRQADDTPTYDQARMAQRYAILAKLRADDHQTLTTAGWVDQSKGVVRIPIDEAMPEEVEALKAKAPQMGQAIPGAHNAAAPGVTPAAAAVPPAPPVTTATTPVVPAAPAQTTPKAPKTKSATKAANTPAHAGAK